MKEVRDDPCSFEECDTSPLYDVRRGLCKDHYMWFYDRKALPPKPTIDELMIRWRRVTDDGCWEWRGAISSQGYGQYIGQYVHRISAERAHGPIDPGLHVDHLCRNRRCFNPDHLEPVTNAVNVQRGAGAHILNTGRCAAGHEMDEANTRLYVSKAGRTRRICRACHRNRARGAA